MPRTFINYLTVIRYDFIVQNKEVVLKNKYIEIFRKTSHTRECEVDVVMQQNKKEMKRKSMITGEERSIQSHRRQIEILGEGLDFFS